MTKHRTKNWNNLVDLRDHLVRTGSEKVKTFNGHELVTDQGRYTLLFGSLNFYPLKKEAKKMPKNIKVPKSRDPVAHALRSPQFKSQVVPNKKKVTKPKHKGKTDE